jgi:hypothetical protein
MTEQLCGAYADHVDHIRPRSWWPGVRPRVGSTTAWRRLRLMVLDRDSWRCQVPVDAAGQLDATADRRLAHGLGDDDQPTGQPLPPHPDDPANLRAACARHNLQRGNVRPAAPQRRRQGTGDVRAPWRW